MKETQENLSAKSQNSVADNNENNTEKFFDCQCENQTCSQDSTLSAEESNESRADLTTRSHCQQCEISMHNKFLMCERKWIYFLLTIVAGIFGAYTYLVRGKVFCNAQTGNLLLMGIALGNAQWKQALYYLLPMTAYIAGSFISEILPNAIKRRMHIRWDTLCIGIEILAVIALGFVPHSVPVQISQVAINFLASMQYNTFRQAEGNAVSTVIATNHVRLIGVSLAKVFTKNKAKRKLNGAKALHYVLMILSFVIGVVGGAILCKYLDEKAIWVASLPLLVIFIALLYADLVTEKDLLEKKPSGH